MPRWGWRWLLALSSVGYCFVLILYKLAPESPRFLCTKGRLKEAQNILEKAAQFNNTKLPAGNLCSDKLGDIDEKSSSEEVMLSSSSKKINESKRCCQSLSAIFSRRFIRTTLLLWLLYFGNTFSYYGIVLLTSELSSGQSKCGVIKQVLSDSMENNSLYINVFVTSLAGIKNL